MWAALITPARIANGLQADAVVEPWVGGRYSLAFRNSAHWMEGEITRFEPLAVLEFTWPEIEANVDSLVLWELSPVDAGCRVVLTHTLTGGGDAVDFASGWHWHLDALGPAADVWRRPGRKRSGGRCKANIVAGL